MSTITRPRRQTLLRHRNFRLLWFGETVSQIGTAVTTVALPLVAIETLHASTFQIAVLESAVWLPWLLIGLPAGAWVDRLRRRRIMLSCHAVSATLLASVPLAAWAGALTIAHLLLTALGLGVCAVFAMTAYEVFLPAVVAPDHLAEANAKVRGSESSAQILGPGLGGLLARLFGPVAGLLANAVSFFVCALCLARVRVAETVDPAPRQRGDLVREIRDGLRFIVRDPYLRPFTLYAASANLMGGALTAIVVVFLVREVGVDSAIAGALISGGGVGGVVGALLARRVIGWLGTARSMVVAELVAMPFALMVPLTTTGPGLVFFVAGTFVFNAGVTVSNVIIGSFRQTYCPRHLLGRVTASGRFLSLGALPVGALLGGALATYAGLRAGVWIISCLQIPAVVILLLSPIRRRRDMPTEPASEPASGR
ncbi:MFS transporter [Streptoalloteichus hindustanus]|uniref:Predicted arabinose efflux permease, MFS family n=1 Tax=Streptoalloteichus hindustanus TaxID=2017 RepID=A0A1M5ETJ4_STRHI|nr:MFS transporter [Streptoalloteichus hindustanus]SHF82510.1 Predicted arabinose efflux permease, MFS family [Streptoalloteichus hindustanus]